MRTFLISLLMIVAIMPQAMSQKGGGLTGYALGLNVPQVKSALAEKPDYIFLVEKQESKDVYMVSYMCVNSYTDFCVFYFKNDVCYLQMDVLKNEYLTGIYNAFRKHEEYVNVNGMNFLYVGDRVGKHGLMLTKFDDEHFAICRFIYAEINFDK